MSMIEYKEKQSRLWTEFQQRHSISKNTLDQLKAYWALIIETNKKFNLTTITDLSDALWDHFEDSLALCSAIECDQISWLADIGTGAGFPGIPLKLMQPDMTVSLIEVNIKKISFLKKVIDDLQLKNIEVIPLDWRTFLRQSDLPITLFCARASLKPKELIRMFQPASPYRRATLVYWASEAWAASPKAQPYVTQEALYPLRKKKRKLVFFTTSNNDTGT